MNGEESTSHTLPIMSDQFYEVEPEEDRRTVSVCPVKLVGPTGRKFIWWMCKLFNVHNVRHGVVGQTCQLFEKYLSVYFHDMSRVWLLYVIGRDNFVDRIPLLVSVCLWLSVKMQMGHGHRITSTTIRRRLLIYDIDHSVEEIKATELNVFRLLGYRIPIFTCVEKAMMLAKDIGLDVVVLEGISSCVDLSEYYRDSIQECVQRTVSPIQIIPDTWAGTRSIRNKHLAAGAVAASCRYLQPERAAPLRALALRTRAGTHYIECIANAILKHIVPNDDEEYQPGRKIK